MPGGTASRDGKIQAGDQLLSVDGVSLVGITQVLTSQNTESH